MSGTANFAQALLRATRGAGVDPSERRWKAGEFVYRQGFPTKGLLVLTGGLTKASIVVNDILMQKQKVLNVT